MESVEETPLRGACISFTRTHDRVHTKIKVLAAMGFLSPVRRNRSRPGARIEAAGRAARDKSWFFSDPERVRRFAGRVVAVANEQVLGSGTATEAYEAAKRGGEPRPLLIDLTTTTRAAGFRFGL